MRIGLTTIYVDDQENALRFYTEVLGFTKKADICTGLDRWLTVASAEEPNGPELQLAPNSSLAAKAYQQAMFRRNRPAATFFVDDVQLEYDRMTKLGATFKIPPTEVTGSTIAMLDDTCGNLIQITTLNVSGP